MSDKYLIFGATGSIGSSLAQQLKDSIKMLTLSQEMRKSSSQFLKNLALAIRCGCFRGWIY